MVLTASLILLIYLDFTSNLEKVTTLYHTLIKLKIVKYDLVYYVLFEKVNSILVWILLFPYTTSLTMDFTDSMIKIYIGLDSSG